ncbi:hypothetical protein H4R33_004037 [Dimargaris cristalligena]|uniref:Uncharacterized protein n=1 Tax=Dimargaris cristalligena TaxID=215637 RepID=A0A4P9ZQH2_9FUNG|nr:hypothetical protein H4R33_004037 [Dimargaris cristalligena]RKP34650.1 hypothetical protein BJ085DRAFT_34577 [Dimargaris cristalligena]|eukprot:RKP34650.1 hypothetical protein BJ085DRAFT_34577 [Dimargaris cristalligena]
MSLPRFLSTSGTIPRIALGVIIAGVIPAGIWLGARLDFKEPEAIVIDMTQRGNNSSNSPKPPTSEHSQSEASNLDNPTPTRPKITRRDYLFTRYNLLEQRETLLHERKEKMTKIAEVELEMKLKERRNKQ